MTQQTCWECRYFTVDAGELERLVPGLRILSSAYSAVRADNGICGRRDIVQRPIPACADFDPVTPPPSR